MNFVVVSNGKCSGRGDIVLPPLMSSISRCLMRARCRIWSSSVNAVRKANESTGRGMCTFSSRCPKKVLLVCFNYHHVTLSPVGVLRVKLLITAKRATPFWGTGWSLGTYPCKGSVAISFVLRTAFAPVDQFEILLSINHRLLFDIIGG